ncbi:hypothetical protein ACFYPZ_21045 [Streptomyces sp. NPDC005506]|uniref:hypothetical protein n=1 Tax=unclassified Streptomyces TaxID=2593676 RepID=UPI003684D382
MPSRRSRSARSAQSTKNGSICLFVISQGNGEYQTCSPAAAAYCAATSIRSGSSPMTRIALQ